MAQRMKSPFKWKAFIALLLIIIAVVMNWNWVWGILFIYWLIPDLYYQETHLVERVTRAGNPILYWMIMVTWLVLSIWSFFG